MHILHIETGRHLYGGALQVLFLLRGLAESGCRNSLACPSGSAIASAAGACSQLCEIPARGDLDPALMLRLRGIIAAGRPDLVHVHSRRGADLWGALAAWSRGVPVLITRRVDNPENLLTRALEIPAFMTGSLPFPRPSGRCCCPKGFRPRRSPAFQAQSTTAATRHRATESGFSGNSVCNRPTVRSE